MTKPQIRGWCPGAHRPMMSGDGLVLRVRPRLARLTREQLLGLCAAARRHGNGVIELTNRGNLQLRGVRADSHPALLATLSALGLLDDDPTLETRRNILVQPFYPAPEPKAYRTGAFPQDAAENMPEDPTVRLAAALEARLAELPALPVKFGYAIDIGAGRWLGDCSADIRLERGVDGGLILRADGAATGRPVDEARAVDALIEMAWWFDRHRDPGMRRMAQLVAAGDLPPAWQGTAPAPARPAPRPGPAGGGPQPGPLVGLRFGQIPAAALARVVEHSGAAAIRVTPWRLLCLEGGRMPRSDAVITRSGNPLLAVDACPGAPHCPQAQAATRPLAADLAPRLRGSLHVSGCAKGCARSRPAQVTLVARDGRFDLIRDGCAGDKPERRGLSPETLLALLSEAETP